MKEIILDAKNQRLGRFATKIAHLLQGKDSAEYEPRLEGENRVVVKNIKDIEITGKKAEQKIYYRHTGYMGHLREKTYQEAFAKNPAWVLQNAVEHMLPKNKLQNKRMKRLIIEE